MFDNKNYTDMKDDVAEMVGESSSAFKTKIGKWLNKRYRDCLNRYQWTQLFETQTITTVASQAEYPLNPDFQEEVYVWDNTNKKKLTKMYETGEQNDTALTADADYYSIKECGAYQQPSAASVLACVSDNAADTGTLFVKGVSGGVIKEETVTLSGTTPVNTSNSYTAVYAISKSAVSTGIITVTSNSAAKTQATLAPNQLQAKYRQIHFYYIPSTADRSIVVRYKRKLLPLINSYDYPIIDVADVIMAGAEADAWRMKRQFGKASSMEQVYEQELQKKMFEQERDSYITIQAERYEE